MADRRDSAWVFLGACAFALAVLVGAYSNSFQNSFHFDDLHVVEGNLYLRSLKNVPLFFRDALTFSSLPANATYRPLVTTSLAFDYWLAGGLQVWQFHASQVAMLILLGAMLFLLFLKLFSMAEQHWWNRHVALLAALSFCVHATNTETMNLIHARSELLSAMGIVGAFLVYLYLPRARRTYLYLVPMVVGALAKNQAVIFAPLLFVYVWLFEQRLSLGDLFSSRSSRPVGRAIGKTLPALVAGAIGFMFVESMNAPGATYGGGGRLQYLQTQMFVWLHYGRLFFLPVGLTADTDSTLIANWHDTRVVAGIVFAVFLLRLAWSASKTPALRPVAFGIAWFLLALLPASSIFPLAEVSNEHRVFLPFIGLSLAVVWGVFVLAERSATAQSRLPTIGSITCAVVLVFIGSNAVATYDRNKVWRSAETLWRDVTEKSPLNGRGLMNYGLTQMRQGKYEEANRLFERAQAFLPNYATLEINLGIVTDRLDQPTVAEQHFSRALALAPDYPAAHFFYARWLAAQARSIDAIDHLQRAIRLSPADIEARYLLLELYAKAGQTAALGALVDETLKLVPGDPKLTQYLDDRREAVAAQPVETLPSATATTFLNTSMHLYQTGDFQGSIAAARKALDLEPGFAEAYNNIAAAFASLGEWDEAIDAARTALELKPDFPLARNNLAWAEAEKRNATRDSKLQSN